MASKNITSSLALFCAVLRSLCSQQYVMISIEHIMPYSHGGKRADNIENNHNAAIVLRVASSSDIFASPGLLQSIYSRSLI